MAKPRIDLESTVRFLNQRPVQSLDALYLAIESKFAELDVKPSRRAHKTFPTERNQNQTGNLKGVIDFVNAVEKDDEDSVSELQTLRAVVATRYKNAGMSPPEVEESAEA